MLKSKFFKNNAIFMAGTLISGLLGYAFHFAVSRQISVAQYGELQSLLSIFIIFGVFNSALSYFVIRHTSVFAAHNDRDATREFASYLQAKVFRFAVALLFVLIIFSPLLALFLHFSSYVGFIVISLATFLSTMTVIYFEILRGWEKFFLLSVVGTAAAFVKFLSGAILAIFSHKTAVVSFAFLLTAFVSWYLAKLWSKEKIIGEDNQKNETGWLASNASPARQPDGIYGGGRSDAGWKNKYFSETNIRRTAAKIFFFSLALVLLSNLDVVLVKYFSTAEIAGYYGAFGLLGKISLWLNLAVVGVMLPAACADGHSGKRPDKKNILNTYGLMAAIGLGLILVYYIMPDFIINLFFGKKYILDTQILWLFALMSFLLSILTLEANLSFAKRDFRVIYFIAITTLLMISGLAKFHGNLRDIVLSLIISFLIGYVSVAILNISHENRRLKALNQ